MAFQKPKAPSPTASSGGTARPRALRSTSSSRQLCALSRAPTWKPTSSFFPSGVSLLSLAAVAWFALKPAERFPEYVPWLVPILAPEEIAGPVTHVRDGDTIEVGGHAIRFGSLDCAELVTTAGQRAKTEMQSLVGGAYLVCRTNGRRSHDRWIGSCSLPDGKDLAGIMIARNICRRYW